MPIDDELTNFILRSREKRRSDEQIVRALLSVGWKKDKVEAAFRKLREEEFLKEQEAEAAQTEMSALEQKEAAEQEKQAQEAVPQKAQPPPALPQQPSQPSAPKQPLGMQQQVQSSPQQKKPPFGFPNIFGKKASSAATAPSSVQASPAVFPQAQSSEEKQAPQTVSTSAQPPKNVFPPKIPAIPQPASKQPGARPALAPMPLKLPTITVPEQPRAIPLQQMQPQAPSSQQSSPPRAAVPQQQAGATVPSLPLQPQAKPYLKPLWPSDAEGGPLPPGVFPSGHVDESSVQNPAFANVASALPKEPGVSKIILLAAALFVILLIAAGAYVFIFSGAQNRNAPEAAQFQPPSQNQSQLQNQSQNATGHNQTWNGTNQSSSNNSISGQIAPAGGVPPSGTGVQLGQNNSSSLPKNEPRSFPPSSQNSTAPAPSTIPVVFVPSQNATQNSTSNFTRVEAYKSTAFSPPESCRRKGGVFVGADYREHYGSECTNFNGKKGTDDEPAKLAKCYGIPCCVFPGEGDKSFEYLSFTCGFY